MNTGVQDAICGQTIAGKYRIIARVGVGGMGGVYKAEHLLMDRMVAIKLLPPTLASDEISLKRFEHEARIASQLTHPNAVVLHDFGVDGEFRYLVMELIEGKTLKEVVADREPMPLARVGKIISQVGSALSEAHSHGIVHRDIKPSNIMLTTRARDSDFVKVVDFGIAKVIREAQGKGTDLTLAGSVMGTPQYLSPEQVLSKELDPRSDIYSLGIVLFELLSGSTPYDASSTIELMMKHVYSDVPSLRAKALEKSPTTKLNAKEIIKLDAIVQRCLQKDPKDRYQSIEEFLSELDGLLHRQVSYTRRSMGPFISGAVLGGLLLISVVALKETKKISSSPVEKSTHEVQPLVTEAPVPVKTQEASREEISGWVHDLMSGDEASRELATDSLLALGSPEALQAVDMAFAATVRAREERLRLAVENETREKQAQATEDARSQDELRRTEEAKAREEKMREEMERAVAEAKAENERLLRAADKAEEERQLALQQAREAKLREEQANAEKERAAQLQQKLAAERRATKVTQPVGRPTLPPVQDAGRPKAPQNPTARETPQIRKPDVPPQSDILAPDEKPRRKRCGPSWCM